MTKTPEQIREEVKRQPPYEMYEAVTAEFRKYMIKELAANSAKGDREGEEGWLGCDNKFWLSELYYHVGKLQSAVMNNDVERVKENTADIANLAMMVLDNWIGLAPIPFIAACNWLQSEQAPTPPQGEEGGEVGIKHHLALRRRYEAKKKEISTLTAELTALRSQLSEAQENYEKVWDAAEQFGRTAEWAREWGGKNGLPDKTTFINKIKKGKE
jgi:hypothetical protein